MTTNPALTRATGVHTSYATDGEVAPNRAVAWIRDHPLAVDVVVALGLLSWWTIAISLATEDDAIPVDTLAYAMGFVVAGALLFRRHYPAAVLLAVYATTMAYHMLQYPAPGYMAILLMVPVYSAALYGRRSLAFTVSAAAVGSETLWRIFGDQHSPMPVIRDVVPTLVTLVAVLLLAEVVRTRRAWVAEVQQRMARDAEEREQAFRQRIADERLGMARELHDVLAHTISVITVQAGAAADGLDPDDPRAAETRAALQSIRATSREAMTELRATVGVLRKGAHPGSDDGGPGTAPFVEGQGPPSAPAPGLTELPALAETVRARGVDVLLEQNGADIELPPSVDLTAYRIIQEALTNVVRHAQASEVQVHVAVNGAELVVQIADDGRGGDIGDSGWGIVGMHERATVIGGTLTAGPRPEGGFAVEARLPLPGD